ncbi:CPSF7 factor, partial [Nothocercus nigrocapillus]|nr:CPSF7 factor [Nothocercus nigrocapillus]
SQDSEFSNADQMDLYDDVLAASSQPAESRTSSSEPPPEIRQEPSPKPNNKSPAILYTYSGLRNKRAAVYVGSFSWWTTDQQLIQTIRSVGVYDVVELKFAENRANGQSKGYAEVVVASENSVHKLLELLPGKVLNGDKVEVRLATRQNLSQFEAQARKRKDPCALWPAPTGPGDPQHSYQAESSESLGWGGTARRLCGPRARMRCSAAWQRRVLQDWGRASALPYASPGSPSLDTAGDFSVSLGADRHQVFLPPEALALLALGQPRGEPCSCLAAAGGRRVPAAGAAPHADRRVCPVLCSRELGPPPPTVSEVEFEEIMNRNRAISSSAISKAVSGASAGDYSDAIETLLTAIAVIKQSRVANDERCRVLLSSLKDCLHGIEAKSYSTGASSSSSRKRHRSRERSPSRSRESSRRHRDVLHSEDRHEDYFQERNREHDRHRDRDRERDR